MNIEEALGESDVKHVKLSTLAGQTLVEFVRATLAVARHGGADVSPGRDVEAGMFVASGMLILMMRHPEFAQELYAEQRRALDAAHATPGMCGCDDQAACDGVLGKVANTAIKWLGDQREAARAGEPESLS